jgi:hypothetical protein
MDTARNSSGPAGQPTMSTNTGFQTSDFAGPLHCSQGRFQCTAVRKKTAAFSLRNAKKVSVEVYSGNIWLLGQEAHRVSFALETESALM